MKGIYMKGSYMKGKNMNKIKYSIFIVIALSMNIKIAHSFEHFNTEAISKSEYEQLSEGVISEIEVVDKITDIKVVKEMLSGRVIFNDKLTLITNNGITKELLDQDSMYTCQFNGYYTEQDLLYFICGHESDIFISLIDGSEIEEHPESIQYSPNKKFKLSSYYGGQENLWSIYQNNEGQWSELKERSSSNNINLHTILEFKWLTDNKFIFSRLYDDTYFLSEI